jgi:hypothetical protein
MAGARHDVCELVCNYAGQLTAVTRCSAARGNTMFIVYKDSASGVSRKAARSAASGVGSGLMGSARFKILHWLTGFPDVIP